jgi:hypothetical protein
MRTTLDLPKDLLEEARNLLGCQSKTEAVILSLCEVIRRRRVSELKGLMGAIELEIDLPKSRRRPNRATGRGSE